ncbi:MAG: hypothetical protein WBA36_18905 [Mesorhizobium sp.]
MTSLALQSPASCVPTHDGIWIAHDPLTRLSASGRTKAEAVNALLRLIASRPR